MDQREEKGTGFAGQHHVTVPIQVVATARRDRALLRDLVTTGAGYFPKALGHLRKREGEFNQTVLIFCVKGGGWCEIGGQLHPVRGGDLLGLPARIPHAYGSNDSDPWTIHWVHVVGEAVPEYLKEMGVSAANPVLRVGEDIQITRLFNEALTRLESGPSFLNLLQASKTVEHLMALLVRCRHECVREDSDAAQKVAHIIGYMSEHMDQPLRITQLAALANLSPAHFSVRFKQQTGSSPRDYLHLLRIHRACQLLHSPALSAKEIAARVGYADPFHFSRQFKAVMGVSPTEYRNTNPG